MPTADLHTLSLHDALPIFDARFEIGKDNVLSVDVDGPACVVPLHLHRAERAPEKDLLLEPEIDPRVSVARREVVEPEMAISEEHTSELQSPMYLVCRLLLE